MKFLLDCGANVNARNSANSTPLHVASAAGNYNDWLVPLLLEYGAHLDIPNGRGEVVIKKINVSPFNLNVKVLNHISLACLCASVIAKNGIPFRERVPKTLEQFIEMHKP